MAELAKSCYIFPAILFLVSFGLEVITANEDDIQSPSNIRYFLYQSAEYPRDCQEVVNQCSSDKSVSGVYLIRPVQYPEPFEVYCDNNVTLGGWTVIQRRFDGYINFNRSWNDFKFGFGFVGSEFWMGNERLAHLTNQKRYKLRIDLENTEGQSYYIAYDNFRIADEWGSYSLLSLGAYESSDLPITWCVTNKHTDSQSICERSCENPDQCVPANHSEPERCICEGNYMAHDGSCIPKEQCGCYDHDNDVVVGEGDSLLKSRCSVRITCSNNRLISDNYRCGDDATCEETDGVGRCICNEWFQGDGVTCTRNGPTDCYDLYMANRTNDTTYTIYPEENVDFEVYCDMSNGGWTILQKRTSGSLNFYRNWDEYETGFGNSNGDHWLGNEKMHILTKQKTYKLRMEKTDGGNSQRYTEYSHFEIGSMDQKYELLSLGTYSGTSGNDAMAASVGAQFSTHNEDNDGSSTFNCAQKHRGGWWYPDDSSTGTTQQCYTFSNSVATGRYETQYSDCGCYAYCSCSGGCYYSGTCYLCHSGDCSSTCCYSSYDACNSRPHHKCTNCDGCSGDNNLRCCRNQNQVEIVETNFYFCGDSNLNGDYQYNDYRGIFWKNLQGSDCGITATTMKIRPILS